MRRPHASKRFYALLLLCLTATGLLRASPLIYMPIVTQASRSALVVRGRVSRVTTGWDRERRCIWTTARLEVLETLQGELSASESLSFSFLGGIAPDGIRMTYFGIPHVREGGEIIVFLARSRDGRLVPWALKQSIFRVERSKDGTVTVIRDRAGVRVVPELLAGETPFGRVDLVDFRARLSRGAGSTGLPGTSKGGK